MDVLLTFLISVSATLLVVRSKIMESVRLWVMKYSDVDRISIGYAINCPQCMGIWIGLFVGILFYQVSPTLLFLTAMTFGTSLLAMVADRYLLS